MIKTDSVITAMINSPVREVRARVELLEGSTLLDTFKYTDALKSFDIQRVGDEGKFFGFGIVHRLNVKLVDRERKINITTANSLDVAFGAGSDYVYPFPAFHVSEVRRDENTNQLSITAYDVLYSASKYTVNDLRVSTSYTIREFAAAIANKLNVPLTVAGVTDSVFNTYYPTGANFEGTETLREALDDIAEATQTIYYLDYNYRLTFKRLDKDGKAALTIGRDSYFDLDSKTNRRLVEIVSATELGDNIGAAIEQSGTTQYVRDNAFWTLREDVATLVNQALAAMGGITINQYELDWRGNFLLEIGDKISLELKDGSFTSTFLLDDELKYNGSLSQSSRWSYGEGEDETASNPSSLGDVLTQTFAKVDKANKQIDIVASETSANAAAISSLQMDTENIRMSVENTQEATENSIEEINNNLGLLTNKVEATMSAEDVKLVVSSELANGASKVTTSTGFTFNEDGLRVSKSGSEMETQITEDGMRVYRDGEEMLTASNTGVDAVNLHATTYLIVGENSRFEDYGDGRTGCFWIGG